jgi:flagellar assembly factor FliW
MKELATSLSAKMELPEPEPELPAALLTRFGEVQIDRDRLITFPHGVLGFADCRRYALTDLPGREIVFKLLQSVDQPELAFLVLPLELADGPIGQDDLWQACSELAIGWPALVALAIVTVRQEAGGEVHFSINLKAPLLIDSARQVGHQHVFTGEAYPLRHDLPRAEAA